MRRLCLTHRNKQGVITADRPRDVGQGGSVQGDADQVRRAGRGAHDDQLANRLGGADPFANDSLQPLLRSGGRRRLVGERVHCSPIPPHLDRAQLVEVARHGRLGDRQTETAEALTHLLLTRQRLPAKQLGKGAVAVGSTVRHMNVMHTLA